MIDAILPGCFFGHLIGFCLRRILQYEIEIILECGCLQLMRQLAHLHLHEQRLNPVQPFNITKPDTPCTW